MIIFKQNPKTVFISGSKDELVWLYNFQKARYTQYLHGIAIESIKEVSFWGMETEVSHPLGEFLYQIAAGQEDAQWIPYEPKIDKTEADLTLPGITLRDYQEKAVMSVLSNKCGIIHMAVNAGKTEIMASICKNFTGKILVLVPTAVLLKQTIDRFKEYFGEVGICGSSKLDLKPRVVVGIAKSTLTKTLDTKFDLVLVDECHKHTSKTTADFFNNQKQALRFGFSGTPFHASVNQNFFHPKNYALAKKKLTEKAANYFSALSLYGKVLEKITTKELVDRGISSEGKTVFVKAHSRQNNLEVPIPNQSTEPTNFYKYYIQDNLNRNLQIANFCIQAIQSNQVCCVSFKHVEHLKEVYELTRKQIPEKRIEVLVGETKKKERDQIISAVNRGEIHAIFVSGAFGTGVSINVLDCLINGAGGLSSFDVIQRFGRVLRKNGDRKFTYIDFADTFNETHKRHSKSRFKMIGQEFGSNPAFFEDQKKALIFLKEIWDDNNSQ